MSAARLLGLTALAMTAFAANSVLTRMALVGGDGDAAGFMVIRVLSAALMLIMLVLWRDRRVAWRDGDVIAATGLFVYMVFFSFAYVSLAAGTGALILFGMVQLTMFGVAFARGTRFGGRIWAGLALASVGLIWLLAPGASAPDPLGAALMAVAGVGWGAYSLRGAQATNALRATTANFLWIAAPTLLIGVFLVDVSQMTMGEITLAVLSGAFASACGYALWYAAIPALGAARAAVVQLSAPAIAALGGAMLLSEPITLHLLAASATILGGVGLALSARAKQ